MRWAGIAAFAALFPQAILVALPSLDARLKTRREEVLRAGEYRMRVGQTHS